MEGADDSRHAALLEALATDGLKGRNLVSILRTVLQFVASSGETATFIDRILDEVDAGVAQRTPSHQGRSTSAVYSFRLLLSPAHDPQRGCVIARRILSLSTETTFDSNHVWLIPGRVPVALIESIKGEPTAVELPLLANPELLEELVVKHAEEYEHTHDLGRLRQQLSSAIEPLRDCIWSLGSPVTIHAFGVLKHIPVAALTGHGSILASKLDLQDPRPRARAANATGLVGRTPVHHRRRAVASSPPPDVEAIGDGALQLQRPRHAWHSTCSKHLRRSGGASSNFFGHGHVDQFHVGHTGLVVEQAETGNGFIPSTDLADMDLRSIELAAVMSCGAGQGSVFLEPYLSTAHAFRLAGVTHVIAPQWPIHAQVALDFTNRLLKLIDDGVHYVDAWGIILAQDPNRYISIALFGE